MRALPIVFWVLAFVAASFCWMVAFQYGLSWQAFSNGARTELRSLVSNVTGSAKP
jgi:hypothetical protein